MDNMLLSLVLLVGCWSVHGGDLYSNTWAVHIEGGEQVAKSVAQQHGFTFINQIMQDYYAFKNRRVSKRSLDSGHQYHEDMFKDSRVKWVEQQRIKRRVKRDGVSFNDPKWPKLWYLNRGAGLDMNVLPAYSKWNITGLGIVVSILDDGIEKDHPDLTKNYDPGASYDVNGHDSDPQPRYDMSNENRHGTRCAGEVAAEANNNICSVGVAYDAKIGGVRMLDGDVTDAVEAQSLSLNPQHIDIYSASWGPDDDGRTVDGPGPLARKAFLDGILTGRRGLGSVFVWASGNGGQFGDGCNCDGYTNSMYTLSISSASENGGVPWYSEACSSTLATTYSSGAGQERQIITTDLRKLCTETHTGTSASAPLAAGICALALQANPMLTWRDMQHIVVQAAKKANLRADDWVTNGAGKQVSHHFGFGLMDAGAMVELARVWKTVPAQRRCVISGNISAPRNVPINGFIEADVDTDGCRGSSMEIRYLEHVEAVVTLSTSVRGQVQVFLTSPAGTRSTLLATRSFDTSSEGFNQWPFMTTHNWNEDPSGKWRLEVRNGASVSTLKNWNLVLYGTSENPFVSAEPSRMDSRKQIPDNSCTTGEYYLQPLCYTHCPSGFYPFNNSVTYNESEVSHDGVCLRCHSMCVDCTGPQPHECTACAPHRHLNTDNRCVDTTTFMQLSPVPVGKQNVTTAGFKRYSLPVFLPIGLLILAVLSYLVVKLVKGNGSGKEEDDQDTSPLLKEEEEESSGLVNYNNSATEPLAEKLDEIKVNIDDSSSLESVT